MTKRDERDVDKADLRGYGLILPGDARHSEYHGTDAEGRPKRDGWSCMKVYGIKAKVAFGKHGAADGPVRFRAGAEGRDVDVLSITWEALPPMSAPWMPLDPPLEFSPAVDRWSAPDVVEALYLRTSPDREEYVCPTLHR